jgi:kinesin family protein 3/17
MCSYIELYNEELRDLLHINEKFKLELRESPEKGVFIKDVKKIPITSVAEMMKYLKIGNQNRTTGETLMNTESSRSHSIFTIYVESLEKGPENIDKLMGSKFNLVDLAGSERQSKTGSIGDRFL